MKKITLLVLLFSFSFVFAVMSEDLGELAKKEKARREALDKSGKTAKVFTNDDIDKLKSEVAMESKSSEGEATESAPPEEQPDYTQSEYQYNPPVEGQDYVPDPEPEQQATDPLAERNKKLRDLETQSDELEKKAKDAIDNVGAGGLWHSRNTGDQYRTAREAEAKQEKLDQEIDSTKQRQVDPRQIEPTPPAPVEEYVPPQEQLPPEEPPATEEEPPF